MADENLDANVLNKLRVVDLREHLSKRGLPTSGLKAELVKRLREALLSESEQHDDDDSNEEPDAGENVTIDDPNIMSSDSDFGKQLIPEVGQEVFIKEDENVEYQQIPIEQPENVVSYVEYSSDVIEEQVVIDEQQIMLEEELVRAEQEKLEAEEQQKIWKAEQKRLQIEEQQRQAEEEQRRIFEAEQIRIAEEERALAMEKEKQLAEEQARRAMQEQQRRIEEEQRQKAEEEQRRKAEEEQRRKAEEEQRRKAEEEQRRKTEEEQRRKAEEEQRRKVEEEHRRKVEEEHRQRVEEEQRRKAEEEQRRKAEEEQRRKADEEQRRRIEEEQRRIVEERRKKAEKEQQRIIEEQRKKAEELQKRIAEEEQKRKMEEEQKKRAEEEEKRRAEEQRQRLEEEQRKKEVEEKRKKAAEEQKKRSEEDRIRKVMEERNRKADEEQRRMLEEQENELRWAEQQHRKFEEQRQHRIQEHQRLLAEQEEHKRLLAEEQHRLLEEEQMIAEKQKILMAEQQQKLLEQQKHMADEETMLAAQQKLIIEQEILKEQQNDLLKLQQQAIKEKEEEHRLQHMTSHNISQATSGPPPIPGVLLSHPSQISSAGAYTHSLAAPPPTQSSQIHLTTVTSMNVPPPTILMSAVPPRLSIPTNSAMSIVTHLPPPNIQNISLTAPPPPRFTHPPPPPPPSTASNIPGVPSSSNQNSSAIISLSSQSHPSLPPQSTPSSMMESDVVAPGTSENLDSISEDAVSEIKLPQALEKVLALKTERAQLLGVDPDAVVQPLPVSDERDYSQTAKQNVVTLVTVDEDETMEEENVSKSKESKGRRRKKKKKKHQLRFQQNVDQKKKPEPPKETSVDIDIEYVQDVLDVTDPLYSHFVKIFEKFKLNEVDKDKDALQADATKVTAKEESINPMALRKKPMDIDDDDDDDERDDDDDKKDDDKPKLSKRKLKKLSRMSVAELKQKVNRPELVEMHDVTAKDPILLLHLKASRNTVPVPRHWCFKRKYLQGKRGIEKPAFELPDFIKRTGIMEMRQALQEKEDQKTMKAKMRERVRPKMGKIDIDYQKLHDAFFKWQTKPRMTIHGDLYYEGKEFETRLKEKKPGDLSEDLRTALGMPTGPNANKCPPPWLIAMQRYGPPPSYPNLKIPGLNAPIPDSCSFGYHAGGWGKPPVDETGRPLYGDVFGTQLADNQPQIHEEEIDHTLWGELESESSEEEVDDDEEEDEEEEEEKVEDETGLVTPAEGLITPSGFSSIPAGMETPDMIELRKRKIEAEMEGGETPALYTILPEKKTERVGAAMMGSTHIYDLAGAIPAGKIKLPGTTSVPPQGIEVALDPSELELDTAAMAARYEQTMREQQSQLEKEDLSDMVAEHAARQKNKRKKQQMDSAKPPKKYKEFKF